MRYRMRKVAPASTPNAPSLGICPDSSREPAPQIAGNVRISTTVQARFTPIVIDDDEMARCVAVANAASAGQNAA